MKDLDLLHFEQLKNEIQAKYLENHHPSDEKISNWKGIDIIYFQEDLRKITKANISEKSFYTYFKSSPVSKLPRIDILNLLSVYAGYASWYDFKKNHLFANEILKDLEDVTEKDLANLEESLEKDEIFRKEDKKLEINQKSNDTEDVLQIYDNDKQTVTEILRKNKNADKASLKPKENFVKKYIWLIISAILALLVGFLGLKEQILAKEFTYTFIDADRNSKINDVLDVKILKENESPILFKVKPNEPFVYTTKSKELVMEVSSPYYKTDKIIRNLESAPSNENIELKPNDYAIMLYYYSNSKQDIQRKQNTLKYLISDNALIYQVYDNDKYGIETLTKDRYITLVTTPTTSLKNMEVIDTHLDKGKIVLIKFRITNEENQ